MPHWFLLIFCFNTFIGLYLREITAAVVAAPLMVHQMRKEGAFGRDMGAGVAAIAMTKGGAMGRIFYNAAQKHSANVAAKQEERRQAKLEQWDRLYGSSSDFNKRTKAMAASGRRDYRNGLFTRVLGMNAEELGILRESHGNEAMLEAQKDSIYAMNAYGTMSVKDKKDLAAWYKERVNEKRAYVVEAREAINSDKSYTAEEREDALAGLGIMSKISVEPLIETIRKMQEDQQLFDIRDQKDIDKMMSDITGEPVFNVEAREKAGTVKNPSKSYSFQNKEPETVAEAKADGSHKTEAKQPKGVPENEKDTDKGMEM